MRNLLAPQCFTVQKFGKALVLIIASVSCLAFVSGASDAQSNTKRKNLSLTIAVVLASKDIIACNVKNTGTQAIRLDDATTMPLKFIFINPDGKKIEFASSVGPTILQPPPLLQPGETRRWDVDISEYFTRRMLKKGMYCLTWVYAKRESEDVLVEIKSNELFIMKNTDTPKTNIDTGAPE